MSPEKKEFGCDERVKRNSQAGSKVSIRPHTRMPSSISAAVSDWSATLPGCGLAECATLNRIVMGQAQFVGDPLHVTNCEKQYCTPLPFGNRQGHILEAGQDHGP